VPAEPGQAILAACLAGGTPGGRSNQSAEWPWRLIDRPPDVPTITERRVVTHAAADPGPSASPVVATCRQSGAL
jgi:hypothetical protein